MIAEKPEGSTGPSYPTTGWQISWARLLLGLLLSGLGLWFITRDIEPAAIGAALRQADGRYIVLGIAVIVATMVAKAFRWQLMFFQSRRTTSLSPFFWALSLGQIVNTAVPFLRLGEIARIYALDQQAGLGKIRTLSTLVVEKSLDLFMLALTLFILIPLVVLPDFLSESGAVLGLIGLAALLALYLLAYQTPLVLHLMQRFTTWMPSAVRRRLLPLLVSGLEGLASLRSRRQALRLIGSSAVIALLSIGLPLVLFLAFALPLGWIEAAVVDSALSITTTPPSTPGQLGVFEGTVVLVLRQFYTGDQAALIGYALVYHLIVLLPKIVLGGLAASRTNWQWRGNLSQPGDA